MGPMMLCNGRIFFTMFGVLAGRDERTRTTTILPDLFGNGAIKLGDTTKPSASDVLASEPGELARPIQFSHEAPRWAHGGHDIQLVARMRREIGRNFWIGVLRVVVVHDRREVPPGGAWCARLFLGRLETRWARVEADGRGRLPAL